MNRRIPTMPGVRRALALSGLAAGLLAATLAAVPDQAQAAYKARVATGTLTITGDAASDQLVLRLAPGSPTTLEVDVNADGTADFSFDRSTFTTIAVDAGAGDDVVRVDQSAGAFTDETITMNGGDGADTLLDGLGTDTLLGGRGDDFASGGGGSDRILLGAGNDRFQWNPGDGSDTVDGQAGTDLLDFFGSNANENVDISANDTRVRFVRDIAAVAMDVNDVERVGFHALGGADTVVVHDLTRTGARTVDVDLSAFGGIGDALPDTVVATGTDGSDRVDVGASPAGLLVSGLWAQVHVTGGETAYDVVNVATLGGADTVTTGVGVSGAATIAVDGGADADVAQFSGTAGADTIELAANGSAVSTVAPVTARVDTTAIESLVVLGLGAADTITAVGDIASLTTLTLDGGDGDDTLFGANGADLLVGGGGSDVVDGNRGNDRALLGDGDDRFQWDPGDGSDTVEGEAGSDQLDFFGSNIGETVALTANGRRARLTRDVGGVVMDIDSVEGLTLHALGGADTVFVDDLTGTGTTSVDLDLGAFGGAGDVQQDTVVANGTSKPDVLHVVVDTSELLVSGLPAELRIVGSEGTYDTLLLQTLGGDDEVTVAPEVSNLIRTLVNLGADE